MVDDWRTALARKIAPTYAAIPDVRAVALIGGVARRRGDPYSDIDLAVYWERPPTQDERRAAVRQFESALETPVVMGDFAARPVSDDPSDGEWWEEAAFIGDGALSGFKIDVNHHTVAAMDRIIDDVTLRLDTDGGKLERLYSIRRVLVLHGMELIARWQARAAHYPDALVRKLVEMHLSALRLDVAMHLHRNDLLLFYQAVTAAEFHVMGALLALNRVYRPELKRLRDLCGELALKPDDLAARLNGVLLDDPGQACRELDNLVEEVITLVERHMPEADAAAARQRFRQRRRPFTTPPI